MALADAKAESDSPADVVHALQYARTAVRGIAADLEQAEFDCRDAASDAQWSREAMMEQQAA